MATDSARVAVGYVACARGVRGEVGIESLTWDVSRFDRLEWVWLERGGEAPRRVHIESWRPGRRGPLLKMRGVDTPEAARGELVGGYLTVPRHEVPPRPEGGYYVFEIVGCRVHDRDSGTSVGEVTEVLHMPSTDVFAVRGHDGTEILVPAVRDVVVHIDLVSRCIAVRGLEELLGRDKPSPDLCSEGSSGVDPSSGARA